MNLKVERVKSINEALALEKLGVNFIVVSLVTDKRFSDDRSISIKEAEKIKASIQPNTMFAIEIDNFSNFDYIKNILQPDYIQVLDQNFLSEILTTKDMKNVNIIFGSLIISCDDNIDWIIPETCEGFNNITYQLDILGDYDNAWENLTKECGKYPDDLTLKDIQIFSEKEATYVSTDITPKNFKEVLTALPNVKGFTFTLGDKVNFNTFHFIKYDDLLDLLSKVTHNIIEKKI